MKKPNIRIQKNSEYKIAVRYDVFCLEELEESKIRMVRFRLAENDDSDLQDEIFYVASGRMGLLISDSENLIANAKAPDDLDTKICLLNSAEQDVFLREIVKNSLRNKEYKEWPLQNQEELMMHLLKDTMSNHFFNMAHKISSPFANAIGIDESRISVTDINKGYPKIIAKSFMGIRPMLIHKMELAEEYLTAEKMQELNLVDTAGYFLARNYDLDRVFWNDMINKCYFIK